MGRPKKDKTAIVYARIPVTLKKTLQKSADKGGRELSGQVRYIIQEYFAQQA
jgi:hypothetical protein